MGQYWNFKQLDDQETFNTFPFGAGLKYLEQWFKGGLYTAMMILCTDTSSLGHGGGDFQIEKAPEELAALIRPVLGKWAGKRVVFAGDYTEVDDHKDHIEVDGEQKERFTDITSDAAVAVWAMVICDMMDEDQTQGRLSAVYDKRNLSVCNE